MVLRRPWASAWAIACVMGASACQHAPATQPSTPLPAAEPLAISRVELEEPCLGGSVEACVELGRVGLRHGSVGASLPWLVRACELEPQACVALGDALIGRRANASDPIVAAHAYRRACEHGHRGACYELAVLHYLGLGIEVDDPLSARLHHAACEGGVPEGCAYLGHLYDRGYGVRRSADLAAHYRSLACRRGFDDLCERGGGAARAGTVEATQPDPAQVNEPATSVANEPPATEAPRTQPARKTRFKPTGSSPTED